MKTLDLWPTRFFVFENFLSDDNFKKLSELDISGQQHINFPFLESKIKESFEQIFKKEIEEKALEIDITEIWYNVIKQNQGHNPHCHANNEYSGILYISRGAVTNFLDPRMQAVSFDLGYNQSVAKIKAVPNKCVIFPSWIIHWVDANMTDANTDTTYRKTISFNVKFRGNIGKPGSFTEVSV